MKYKKIILMFVTLLLTIIPANALSIVANGQKVNTEPILINGKTFVPLVSIVNSIGSSVNFDNSEKTITLSKDETTLTLKIGYKVAIKNDIEIPLDDYARIINGKTYVPLSFISTNFNVSVSFDNTNKIVYIGESDKNSSSNTYKVIKVIDGDTIEIQYNNEIKKVRLIGVDTPESVHPDQDKNSPYGKTASDFTTKILLDQNVKLEFDVNKTDKYGRLLAYVYIGDKMFNKILLENGMAQMKTYPPNVKYVEEFTKIQEQARKNNIGLWSNYENIFDSSAENEKTEYKENLPQDVNTNLLIKGNKNSKIYHLPGMKYYNKISEKNIVYFSTEKEAIEAGYHKSKI